MKAILEFEAPKSCSKCKLHSFYDFDKYMCFGLGRSVKLSSTTKLGYINRVPECPLKIEKEKECDTCKHWIYRNVTNTVGNIIRQKYCRENGNETYRRKCKEWSQK